LRIFFVFAQLLTTLILSLKMEPTGSPIMKKQAGFTLIELIMVIVILGILSAFALPRFANLSGEAEQASMEGALASVKSASAISHAQYLAAGATETSASSGVFYIDLEGEYIEIVNCYPGADTTNDAASTTTAPASICVAAGIDSDFTCTSTGTTVAVTNDSGSCTFSYTEADTGASPTISDISGC
jgi:MSHA pilin protein MshA